MEEAEFLVLFDCYRGHSRVIKVVMTKVAEQPTRTKLLLMIARQSATCSDIIGLSEHNNIKLIARGQRRTYRCIRGLLCWFRLGSGFSASSLKELHGEA